MGLERLPRNKTEHIQYTQSSSTIITFIPVISLPRSSWKDKNNMTRVVFSALQFIISILLSLVFQLSPPPYWRRSNSFVYYNVLRSQILYRTSSLIIRRVHTIIIAVCLSVIFSPPIVGRRTMSRRRWSPTTEESTTELRCRRYHLASCNHLRCLLYSLSEEQATRWLIMFYFLPWVALYFIVCLAHFTYIRYSEEESSSVIYYIPSIPTRFRPDALFIPVESYEYYHPPSWSGEVTTVPGT